MDLASGHLLALDALAPESNIFDNCSGVARYKGYNLGKGRGQSVYEIVEAMRKATGFNFKTEVIGRRYFFRLVIHYYVQVHNPRYSNILRPGTASF